jgi:2-methylaconitate cis-trans-isomerase PrpF
MGSPDPYGRQLDGMGGGISSTSKICILAPSSDRAVADVEFTFVQVGVKDGRLDMAGNCGNMLAIVGPVALQTMGAYDPRTLETDLETGVCSAMVRILNTNTSRVVHSRFRVEPARGGGSAVSYCPAGSAEMDGVPGSCSRIDLAFIKPGGAKTGRTLPTGNAVDALALADGSTVPASLVDVSNPGVFVRVSDLGIPNPEALDPARVEADLPLKLRLEQIRQAGASRMGLDPHTQSVPKIVLVFPPDIAQQSPGVNIKCLALSMGQAHKAVPLTLGLCLGAAARLPGTIPNQLAVGLGEDGPVVIGHPGGKLDVGTRIEGGDVLSAELWRTGRILMQGDVFY